MKKKIIIIGSGIAGLSIANFLKSSSNYEFIIYERRNSISLDEGYGIQLSVNSISNIGLKRKKGVNYVCPLPPRAFRS